MDLGTPVPKYIASTLLLSSAGLGWPTISAELRSHGVKEREIAARRDLEICLAVVGNENSLLRRIGGGKREETIALAGTAWLRPVGVGDDLLSITAPIPEAMHLCLPTTSFSRLSDDFDLPKDPACLIRYAAVRDGVIDAIGRSILSEMMTETSAGRMYVEVASLMLAAHIFSRYRDSGSHQAAPMRHRLDDRRLHRVLDYVEDHVFHDMAVADLANVACLSIFHFTRSFTSTMGMPPHRYVSQKRLDRAKAMIAAGNVSIAEVAFKGKFSSQASFNRAFRRATGTTPAEYRRAFTF